ncbi:sporulation protein YabP [Alkaliphilus peptidifermentans]|nr:sporulation protein YabP [Alkaliphilus peptidifermentans]
MGKVKPLEDRKGSKSKTHNMILENREKLSISGVEHVNSFNSELIVLETIEGVLTIKGQELDVNKLNLEDGNVVVTGIVYSLAYSNRDSLGSKGSGFLGKMFK